MKSRLILFVMIALAGCAPTKEVHRRNADRSERQIIDAVNSHARAITTFQAKGSIAVESPSFMNSGSFELWVKKPDSVRVDVQGPFGIRVASGLFAAGRYIFYNSFKNEVTEGEIGDDEMPAFMNIQISPKDIIDTFCGMRGFPGEEPDSLSMTDNSYVLYFHDHVGTTRYYVNDKTLYVTGVEHVDSTGAVWSEERFDFDRRDDDTVVPQSIHLIHNNLETAVSLTYETVHVNGPIGEMALTIPPDARRATRK